MRDNGGWPLGRRRTIQFLILMTLLAWATETLLSQWARAAAADTGLVEPAGENFVPGTARFAAGGTLEIRAEATVIGADVKLRQVARWSDADAAVFAPIADLVLARLDARAPFRGITLDELRSTLHDAGVNLAVIKFAGPTSCTVTRSDAAPDRKDALDQWIAARQAGPSTAPAEQTVSEPPAASQPEADPATQTLRALLTDDLATRLGLAPETLQLSFSPVDDKLLNLAGPHFRFQIEARGARNLGDVGWEVTVVTEAGNKKAPVKATARAWQQQVVLTRPVSYKQLIRAEDVQERRALIDRLSDEPVLIGEQVVGQLAARDLKPGTVVTARMVEAVPLVRAGQLVTVVLRQGKVQIKTVARALDAGAFGQTIRVRNESTRDTYEIVLTGPQTGRLGGDVAGTASANIAGAVE